MSTATLEQTRTGDDQQVALRGVGWSGYLTALRVRGEAATPRIAYLDGDVYLMSPSYSHERTAERLGLLLTLVFLHLEIPFIAAGHTTFRRKAKRGGVEGDKTYYLANADLVRGKTRIDLRVDPPPDLAIEAVEAHPADHAVEVYRRLGVREVWVCDSSGLSILVLQPDGHYAEASSSAALPFLAASEITSWVVRPAVDTDLEWGLAVQRWIGEVLLPRHRRPG